MFLNTDTHDKFNVNRFMNIFIHNLTDGMFFSNLLDSIYICIWKITHV